MDKKKLEKRLVIGIQIFAVIGLIIIGFYLGKAYKARRANNNNETIKDFGTKMEAFSMESGDKKIIKFNGKDVTIENKDNNVYLNDKKIDLRYVMGGYVLDKSIILYNAGQSGNDLVFINKDLEIIPFDGSNYAYSQLELVDGKIEASLLRKNEGIGITVGDLFIVECSSLESGDLLRKYKDTLEPYKDELLTATVKFSYDGKEVKSEYVEKETVWDRYGKDIEGESKTYCVQNKE